MGLSYPQPPAFILNQPIVPLTPSSSGGAVTSYSISPLLPAGLSLNASTGVISGAPTAAAAQATYTVTAANSAGSTQGSVSLSVVSAAVAYPSSYIAYTVGSNTQTIKPVATGVTFTSWSVSPPLPPGLTLSATDGSISGDPTAAAGAASYKITGMTSEGQESANLTIVVVAAPLLDLGLSSQVTLMRYSGNSVLSQDATDRWLLQDFTTGATLASADEAGAVLSNGGGSYVDLQNNVMIDQAPAGLNVRSAATGQVMATIPYPPKVSWYRLATDGSYIAAGSPTALMAWSTSGQMIVSHAGDYSKATPFAAPGQIQVALGPAGQSVIETVAVPSGAATVSPFFQGVFNSWFVDGQHFFTNQGTTVWVYSNTVVQQNLTTVAANTQLTGQGKYFWFPNGTNVSVYAVGSNAGPVLTTPLAGAPVPSGTTIGLLNAFANGPGQVTIIDLSGATPVVSGPFSDPCNGGNYAAQSATQWVVGNGSGVICAETSTANPRTLTLGSARGIAAGTSYISVATASGQLFYFNASDESLAGVINFSGSFSASADGTVLAAAPNSTGTTNIISLPSGKTINTFPMSYLALIQTGTSIAFANDSTATTCPSEIMVVPVTGGAPLYCMPDIPQYGTAVFSPDGTLGALSTEPTQNLGSTNVYRNGTLTTAVPGVASGWLDNKRLLATQYTTNPDFVGPVSVGSNIYDAAGNKLGTTTAAFGIFSASGVAPEPSFQVVSAAPDSLYGIYENVIVSLTSGTTTWASGNIMRSTGGAYPTGGITGTQVIFPSDNLVLAQPY
jgi:hypothetical protein